MNDYDQILIPEELHKRVYETMEKAEEKRKIKRKRHFWGKVSGLTVAAMAGIVILTNVNTGMVKAMEKLPLISGIIKVIVLQDYKDKHMNSRMEADIKIPEVQVNDGEESSGIQEMNRQMKQYMDKIITQYEEEVRKMEGTESDVEAVSGGQSVSSRYEIATDNDELFSVRINTDIVMGGSNSCIKIYHVDKRSGQFITLKDLFKEDSEYLSIISDNIRMQMKERMAEDENQYYWLEDEMDELNFKNISENANFYVNEEGKLTIVFDKYEVAPGAMGVIEFVIPTKILKNDVINGYLK